MSAEIIGFESAKQIEPKCSFCKTPKSKVKHMITAENGKAICDKCLKTCTDLITPKESA